MRRFISAATPSSAIALLALFLALTGGAYAAIKLPANSVGSKQIKKNAVTLKKIAPTARRALKGATGPQGAQGPLGAQGPAGTAGAKGDTGPAGPPYTADSNGNVYVANPGQPFDTNIIRIGTDQQTQINIPAVYNSPVGADAVYVGNGGGMGRGIPSSRKLKTGIRPLWHIGARLMRLKPVSYRYRKEPSVLRYGLIAEDVAKVFPALVINGPTGRPAGLKMEQLPALLLAQVQTQQRQIARLEARLAKLERRR